jgi:ribokinase
VRQVRLAPQAMAQPSPPAVVAVGSVNADLVVESRLPKPGETLCASGGGRVFPGGKGANQAAAAARLGLPTAFVGQTGRDGAGQLLRSALSDCGVTLHHCAQVDEPSGQAIIVLQPGGENSIIIVPGANAAWLEPGADALAAVASAKLLLLQREVPESVSLAAARAAFAAGVPVILDAGGDDSPICAELLRLATYISPNETELARLSGLSTSGGEEDVLRAARHLQTTQGARAVLVKLGAHGCLLVPPPPGAPLRQLAFKPARGVVDTTGAGDCFTAAFGVALVEGRTPAEALRFASAAAVLAIQTMGAMPSLPSRREVDELLASLPQPKVSDYKATSGETITIAFESTSPETNECSRYP